MNENPLNNIWFYIYKNVYILYYPLVHPLSCLTIEDGHGYWWKYPSRQMNIENFEINRHVLDTPSPCSCPSITTTTCDKCEIPLNFINKLLECILIIVSLKIKLCKLINSYPFNYFWIKLWVYVWISRIFRKINYKIFNKK